MDRDPLSPNSSSTVNAIGGVFARTFCVVALSRARMVRRFLTASAVAFLASSCAHARHLEKPASPVQVRRQAIRRAQVWQATDVASMDIRMGPQGKGAFAPDEEITCDYVDRKPDGGTRKFFCAIAPGDEVKIKYGETNGEVHAEVAATRLLWALGFPADAMYPVRVVCRGCPADPFHGKGARSERTVFAAAAAERKFPGKEIGRADEGWSWLELDRVDEAAGGAPRAQRDALKLLAVVLQHTDSKPQQQRLICEGESKESESAHEGICQRPVMMINDVGQTFGRANPFNRDQLSGMNFDRWSHAKVWKDPKRCIANLPRSFTGTLEYPRVSEAGRRFLASLLAQLSDEQLQELFETAHVASRTIHARAASVEQWVSAFKQKRDEIVNHSCDPNAPRLVKAGTRD